MRFERVLALSPHTDDVELGAGGTVARLVEEGAEVDILAFALGNATMDEAGKAAEVLGVHSTLLQPGPVETRHFPEQRQFILENLIRIGRELYNPDLVLCPSSFDLHQDHEVIRQEALRAFRTCTILGYDLPWSCRQFDAGFLLEIEERHLITKIKAVECYQSQAAKTYTSALFLESLARVRGVQRGTEYAEAFEVIRWVM